MNFTNQRKNKLKRISCHRTCAEATERAPGATERAPGATERASRMFRMGGTPTPTTSLPTVSILLASALRIPLVNENSPHSRQHRSLERRLARLSASFFQNLVHRLIEPGRVQLRIPVKFAVIDHMHDQMMLRNL